MPFHVRFRDYSDAQIERYLEREQPYDCAGSARCEGLGIALIAQMRGDDPNALIGLPLIALTEMLAGPIIATYGCSMSSISLLNAFISFSSWTPAHPGRKSFIASSEACCLCDTANASFTYMSAYFASFFVKGKAATADA